MSLKGNISYGKLSYTDVSLLVETIHGFLCVPVHTCNPVILEAEARGSWFGGLDELRSENLTLKQTSKQTSKQANPEIQLKVSQQK